MSNVAVIDLGTNTFHLLIVRFQAQGKYDVIYRERCYVYLGGQGISFIGEESYQRGIETLKYFSTLLENYNITDVKAIGTAALRTAQNGNQFAKDVMAQTGIEISIISGHQEALYIANGISTIYQNQRPHLIMDIGGGSVEFIIGNESVDWYTSLDIGISILFQKFMKSDPISSESLEEMHSHLDDKLRPLAAALKQYPSYDLIGAAGTFEVLANHQNGESNLPLQAIDKDKVAALYNQVIHLNLDQRKAIEGIPEHRGKYLVVAMALIIKTLELVNLDSLYVSSYSLKEGVLLDF